ncbi:MAG: tRNA (N(6)-L-threonylcarbamoyladenosine(37)-C(2))-methylthiotransferase MtaB [Candidatus Omnitrophica bacterium CG07_land_8_20_14_0_80_42_15]|uniref:tRNA (N(6)-L-threonylcarbamoyladenosine(37)-C(2))-methylthiotransferase n=1 Tax=Candidatus Aquitaenariimonas noxiae TaxID=1974741 RepID=A0A2J0KSF6_9BACT|nr:MAG: tRNA (N(6)-L-threonylcarbamoyladenosine(37)-C(2))-methylthiotransferase MtaB [Candidatus Omnitrophica bacterium CG07_land_8_20_14_0_80_42_15]
MKTFSIKTLGCKVNQYESQLIRENFLRNGFKETNGPNSADIYIVNTCTVTGRADRESRHLVRDAYRKNPGAKIVVTGCFAEKDSDVISKLEGVTDIIKNSDKIRLISLVTGCAALSTSNFITDFKDHSKAFVKIQDGCSNFCSFCKVPLVRGEPQSRALEEIKSEVKSLLDSGFQEIVLSGVCLGEWGRGIGKGFDLVNVLEEIENFDAQFRIRLSSIELKYITERLLNKMASSGKVCRHLHIPLQSGDDRILKAMNRPYTRKEYVDSVRKIKSFIPEVGVTTDIMVGFPGEEEEHFANTLDTIMQCGFHRIHVFPYSKRKGTKADSLPYNISYYILKDRESKIKEAERELSYEYRKKFLGKQAMVLVEEKIEKSTQLLTGYTDTYIKVLLKGPDSLKGKLASGKISRIDHNYTFFEI